MPRELNKELNNMQNLTEIEIGEVNFSIDISDISGSTPFILEEHDTTYRSFFREVNKSANKTAGTIDIKINLEPGNFPQTGKMTKIFDSNQSWLMFKEGEVYYAVLHPPSHEKPLWAARFTRQVKEVTVYCSSRLIRKRDGKTVILNPVRYPLDQLLHMYILAQHQGAVIHAAGVEINGNGFIFPGPSGAGKSTLCRQFIRGNSSNSIVFSDDRMLVRKLPGMNSNFKTYGTPWAGELKIARNRGTPLKAIFFLQHGSSCKIKQLNRKHALDRLLKVTSIPWYDREVMPGVLSFCDSLITHVPLYELHFTPGLEVVRFLETGIQNILGKLLRIYNG